MRVSSILLCLAMVFPLYGKTIEVSDSASGFSAIQAAIDQAEAGDEIVLMPGVYTGGQGEAITWAGKALILRSFDPNDPAVVASTVLVCAQEVGALSIDEVEEGESTLSGLTVTGGRQKAAIICKDSDLIVSQCHIKDNMAGGIEKEKGRLTILDCIFEGNHADYGGAINRFAGDMEVVDSVFRGNHAGRWGGAINLSMADATFRNCIFEGNHADQEGGAIRSFAGDVDVVHSVFRGNHADLEGGAINLMTDATFRNCVFVGNTAGRHGGATTFLRGLVSLTFVNCTLTGNVAGRHGGAMLVRVLDNSASQRGGEDDNKIQFFNTIVAHNEDASGQGRSIAFYDDRRDDVPTLASASDLEAAVTAFHSCLQLDPGEEIGPFSDSTDTINDSPQWVRLPDQGGDGWGDDPCTVGHDEGLNDDYGDLRLSRESPCIDTGGDVNPSLQSTLDVDGQPRIMGAVIDMGAHEFRQDTIAVTRPKGGEVWASGSSQLLTWTGVGVDGPLDIQWRFDANEPWGLIDTVASDARQYLWAVPEGMSANVCSVQVVPSDSTGDSFSTPGGVFSVVPMTPGVPTQSLWSTLGADAARQGANGLSGPVSPIVAWDVNIPGSVHTSVTLGSENRIHVAAENGSLYTFSSEGHLLWTYETESPLLTAPTVGTDGTIYVGGQAGRLFALDVDGHCRWTWETEGFVYGSAAASPGGDVYVASQKGKLYALANDGSLQWTFSVPGLDPLPDSILASPSVGLDGTVYVGSLFRPNLYALDPRDGSVKWVCACTGIGADASRQSQGIFASPVVGLTGVVYQAVLGNAQLYAIDATLGSVLWAAELTPPGVLDANMIVGDSAWSEPALGPDGTIYVSLDDPYLRAITPEGEVKWIVPLGEMGGFTLAVGGDGLIYAASDDGVLYVVNAQGQQIGQYQGQSGLVYPVLALDGKVLITEVGYGIRVLGNL